MFARRVTKKALQGQLQKEIVLDSDKLIFFRRRFVSSSTYYLKMRIVHQGTSTQWSYDAEFKGLSDFHLNLSIAQNALCTERNMKNTFPEIEEEED